MKFLLVATLALVACTPARVHVKPLVPEERRVELRDLPVQPNEEPLPADAPTEDWVEPLEAGSCTVMAALCPARSGLLISEGRAARDFLYRTRYAELRKVYESDRVVWSAHRELYETQLAATETALQKAQPNWFEQHAFQLGIVGGFLLGAAATVALTFAVNQASQ